LEKIKVKTDRKSFHSFRHTVANQLKQKEVAESYIAELVGHAINGETFGRYGKVFQPEVLLSEAVGKLEFDLKL